MNKDCFQTILTAQLGVTTGGVLCHRESMGYINEAGTCESFWSTAPNPGQNGFMGLDSNYKPLKPEQFKRLNEGRANIGLPAITPEQQAAAARGH